MAPKPSHSAPADDNELDFDGATVADEPLVMTYVPEGGLFDDSSTLFEGSLASLERGRPSSFVSRSRDALMSIRQIEYNEHKMALVLSISSLVRLLERLLAENSERPVFFPANNFEYDELVLNSNRARLALLRRQTLLTGLPKKQVFESPDFKVLRLNLKMGQDVEQAVKTLDKLAIAKLLEKKVALQIKYLRHLKTRVDDTTSKVFVTGDLNAGKSTFCNALLRRKVLPEDQQPCTSVFCEVLDAQINNGIEEVHAVQIGHEYDRHDEKTYEVHPLAKLEDLVYQCETYALLKVYVFDQRTAERSLLGNGVIDVQLIDAPGLNMDLFQTTEVFSRQEEIDLVVFVVNSENHFTLSAKEFIAAAAAEKRYVFIVVNRFDNINDKNKCKQRILEQVKTLSPETHKDASDFVHFVSSSEVLNGDDPDDGGDDEPKGDPDFDHLEESLRRFLLDKRLISKLLPAKNYLINLFHDLTALAELNCNLYGEEQKRKQERLKLAVAPDFESMVQQSLKAHDAVLRRTEEACTAAYNDTRNEILHTVETFGSLQIVPYAGLQYAYEYARETQRRMMDTVVSTVQHCEESAKLTTQAAVDDIVRMGQATLGSEFLLDKVFQSDLMFLRRRDTIRRQLDDLIEIGDFFDPSLEAVLAWLGVPQELVSSTRQHVAVWLPQLLVSVPRLVALLKAQLPTQLSLQVLYSTTKLVTTGALVRKAWTFATMVKPLAVRQAAGPVLLGLTGLTVWFLVQDIPNAFPRKQARKIRRQIVQMDYAHVNADRISKECRLVLNYPLRLVMNSFQTSIDRRGREKKQLEDEIGDAATSYKFFQMLIEEVGALKEELQQVDLENIAIVD